MTFEITTAPLLPWPLLAAFGTIALALVTVAIARRGQGWAFRSMAMALLMAAVINPRIVEERREPRPDLALVVVDQSTSQGIGKRAEQTEETVAWVETSLARFTDLEVRTVRVADRDTGRGTRLFAAAHQALAGDARNRLAGIILITDGQVHDVPSDPSRTLSVPVHGLLTGRADERDRRIVIEQAPAFGLVGSSVALTYRVDDRGDTSRAGQEAVVRFRVDGIDAGSQAVPVDRPQERTLVVDRRGPLVVEAEVSPAPGEVSTLNNRTAVAVSGVRDRLRVLLVSGQPHPGERTWRNLLKSDPSVDLVHFTILRPPEKDDLTPLKELSLIVFPVQELFENKLKEFDLIVFDRYGVRGILPQAYLRQIVAYVNEGGAVLVASGPEFNSADSLSRTPLADILPVAPTGRNIEQAFRPGLTAAGRRHPVSSGLPGEDVAGDDDGASQLGAGPVWGRWFRLVETDVRRGSVLLEGPAGRALLTVDRVGEGRVAVLTSDHIWLWARGLDGGGPHTELLRRTVHWLMKEPDLEEERLSAAVKDNRLVVERRSLGDAEGVVTITDPSGRMSSLRLDSDGEGRARAELPIEGAGLYRIEDGTRITLAAAGSINPLELADMTATAAKLAPVAAATGGGIAWIGDGLPEFRRTAPGRDTTGRGWMGLRRNGSYTVVGSTEVPLLPGLAVLALVLTTLGAAWWREGQ
jgi:hypothetical protein